ncbi:MAG TPA: DUF202 domain-containing protein [Abditibacterium sp.]
MNNSNRTRDHLANERTYLAWMRTAIALIGFGLVIVKLRAPDLVPHDLAPGFSASRTAQIGLLFCAVGLGAVLFATAHYFHIQQAIENENYQPGRRWILTCSAVVMILGAGVVWVVLRA